MTETWRPIPALPLLGIPGGYEASSWGRVRSVDRALASGRRVGGVLLTPSPDGDGYLRVRLGRKLVGVHVAVQLAFAGRPEVRHLDGDQLNNRPENLAWGSRVENEQDKRKKGKEIRDGRGWDHPVSVGTSGTGELPR